MSRQIPIATRALRWVVAYRKRRWRAIKNMPSILNDVDKYDTFNHLHMMLAYRAGFLAASRQKRKP